MDGLWCRASSPSRGPREVCQAGVISHDGANALCDHCELPNWKGWQDAMRSGNLLECRTLTGTSSEYGIAPERISEGPKMWPADCGLTLTQRQQEDVTVADLRCRSPLGFSRGEPWAIAHGEPKYSSKLCVGL